VNSTLTHTHEAVLPSSGDRISTITLDKDSGDAYGIIDPMGIETHWENDSRAVRETARQTKRSVARRVSASRGDARINLGRRIRLLEGISVERAAGSPANPDGRPSRSLHHVPRTTRFTYTPDGQLHRLILCNPSTGDHVTERQIGLLNTNTTGIGGIPAQQEQFTYDETGNWLKYEQQDDGAVAIDQTRTHNRSNQLVTLDSDGIGLAYDKNGNMLEVPTGGAALDGPPRRLVWDAWNRLKEVHFHEDNADRIIAEYQYDAQTRRIITLADEVTRHHYYNDEWRSVEERLDEDTTAERQHVWHPEDRWELILRDRSSGGYGDLDERLYSLKDQLDPVAICDATGSVVERYEYTAFGMVSISNASFIAQPSSSYDWSFLFHGEFRDTATHWYNYGYRYYMPEFGRWPDRDPIGERGGINLYGMVGNGPVNWVDWFGMIRVTKNKKGNCLGRIYAGHGTSGAGKDIERQKKNEKKKPGSTPPTCYISCKGNDHNKDAQSGGWGLDNPPQNNFDVPKGQWPPTFNDGIPNPNAPNHGPGWPDYSDDAYLFMDDVNDRIEEAIAALKKELCNCDECTSYSIRVDCQPLTRKEKRNLDQNSYHDSCGKSVTGQCI